MSRHLRLADPTVPVEAVLDAVSEDDRRWFEVNPHAEFRIRPYIAGENPDPGPVPAGYGLWVRVTQVIPGVRFRQMGYAADGEMPTEYVPELDDALLAKLASLKARHAAEGAR